MSTGYKPRLVSRRTSGHCSNNMNAEEARAPLRAAFTGPMASRGIHQLSPNTGNVGCMCEMSRYSPNQQATLDISLSSGMEIWQLIQLSAAWYREALCRPGRTCLIQQQHILSQSLESQLWPKTGESYRVYIRQSLWHLAVRAFCRTVGPAYAGARQLAAGSVASPKF